MKKILYLFSYAFIMPFLIINANAVSESISYQILSVFSSIWFYLILLVIILLFTVFIALAIFLQKRCKITKNKISNLTSEIKKSEKDYKLLFQNMIVPMAVTQDGKIMLLNKEMEKLTGFSKNNLGTMKIENCIHPDDYERVSSFHKQILTSEKDKISFDLRIFTDDKEIRHVHSDISRILWDKKPAILSLLLDNTEQIHAKAQIVESEEKFRLITENVSDIIWVVNLALDKITYISPSMIEISGYTIEEIEDKEFKSIVVPHYYDGFMDVINKNSKLIEENELTSTFDRYEMQMKHKNGTLNWTETEMKFYKNESNETIVICSTRNINSRKKDEAQINYLLNHDSLTGFKNRRCFEKLLKEYDQKEYYPLTIVFSDINGLKLTNDIFGHNVGDELIKKTADGLQSIAREKDVFARIGGDEFVILMPNTNFENASILVSKIKKELSKQKVYTINCNLSIGFDVKTNESQNIQTIKENAESEMYKEKAANGNVIYQEMLESILNAFYETSPNEKLHSQYTATMCEQLGRKLNLTGNEVYTLREAGRLHNFGKLPDSIKGNKIDPLDKAKSYPAVSYRILTLFDETVDIADFVYQHKENWDGSGYPKGLKGNEIPLISQILAISEHYVSLISGLYGNLYSVDEAQKIINSLSEINYNPEILKIFNEYIKENQ